MVALLGSLGCGSDEPVPGVDSAAEVTVDAADTAADVATDSQVAVDSSADTEASTEIDTRPDAVVETSADVAPEVVDTAIADTAPEIADTAVAETTAETTAETSGDTTPDAAQETVQDTTLPETQDSAQPEVDASVPEPSDTIFGVVVPRSSSWWVQDGRIHRGNAVVRLRGINWFGLETPDRALHGTWFGRSVDDFLNELRGLGFDSLRIPVSPESINPGFASASWGNNAYVEGPATTGRQHLERLIAAAKAADMTLLLDFHTCNPSQLGTSLPGRPDGCQGYDVTRWLADLTTLATLAIGQEHVLGIDLTNEPHALTWAAWKSLAERGGEAVLRANPRLLVFVEGVAGSSEYGGNYPFWGENLTEAATAVPTIPPTRLVFSPHVYGPGISAQSYFGAGNFPANMPAIWRTHFGHLVPRYGFAAGEFGGWYDDARAQGEVAWNDAYVAYLATLDRGQPASFYYWAVNPNSGDTGGLYLDDWKTLVQRRLTLLAPLLAP